MLQPTRVRSALRCSDYNIFRVQRVKRTIRLADKVHLDIYASVNDKRDQHAVARRSASSDSGAGDRPQRKYQLSGGPTGTRHNTTCHIQLPCAVFHRSWGLLILVTALPLFAMSGHDPGTSTIDSPRSWTDAYYLHHCIFVTLVSSSRRNYQRSMLRRLRATTTEQRLVLRGQTSA